MTFKLPLLPVPRVQDEALKQYLERERALLLHLVARLNSLGCGLQFVGEQLAVKLGDETIECDGGLKVVTSELDHGGLAGLGDDDHLKYVSLTPEGDRNQMVIQEVNTPGLTMEAPASYAAPYIQGLDSLLVETFQIADDGKGVFNDVDDGFADPNSHFQADHASAVAKTEELGFVLKEHTRFWHRDTNLKRWNGATNPTHTGALRTWATPAADGVDTTILGGLTLIPAWYVADGSNVFSVEVDWAVLAAPGVTQYIVLRVGYGAYAAGEAIPALTNTDTPVPVPTTVTANGINTTTIDITSGSLSGKSALHVELKRMASGGFAADTLAQTLYVVGFRVKSGVKYT